MATAWAGTSWLENKVLGLDYDTDPDTGEVLTLNITAY